MSNASRRSSPPRRGIPGWSWAIALFLWLAFLCFVPDPRPLGAPQWSVRLLSSSAGLSETAARAASTVALRGIGIVMIGFLLTMALKRLPLLFATPLVLFGTPALALGVKSINFGYFPFLPQFWFIVTAGIIGALAGLALRQTRIALPALAAFCIALAAWGSSTGVSDDLYEAARLTGLHLLENADDIPEGDEAFPYLITLAFAYAEDNSHGTSPVLSNKAAILALGVILGEDKVARVGGRDLEPGRQNERAALRHRSTVHGRNDLSRHFSVSAALTVLSDEKRALSVGVVKEMSDSAPGGSGFSFVDMVANKAGIRFAVLATKNQASGRTMQIRIAQGIRADDLVPDISGLPESISQDAFHSDFGGLGSSKTRGLFDEIDRRVGQCPGLQ